MVDENEVIRPNDDGYTVNSGLDQLEYFVKASRAAQSKFGVPISDNISTMRSDNRFTLWGTNNRSLPSEQDTILVNDQPHEDISSSNQSLLDDELKDMMRSINKKLDVIARGNNLGLSQDYSIPPYYLERGQIGRTTNTITSPKRILEQDLDNIGKFPNQFISKEYMLDKIKDEDDNEFKGVAFYVSTNGSLDEDGNITIPIRFNYRTEGEPKPFAFRIRAITDKDHDTIYDIDRIYNVTPDSNNYAFDFQITINDAILSQKNNIRLLDTNNTDTIIYKTLWLVCEVAFTDINDETQDFQNETYFISNVSNANNTKLALHASLVYDDRYDYAHSFYPQLGLMRNRYIETVKVRRYKDESNYSAPYIIPVNSSGIYENDAVNELETFIVKGDALDVDVSFYDLRNIRYIENIIYGSGIKAQSQPPNIFTRNSLQHLFDHTFSLLLENAFVTIPDDYLQSILFMYSKLAESVMEYNSKYTAYNVANTAGSIRYLGPLSGSNVESVTFYDGIDTNVDRLIFPFATTITSLAPFDLSEHNYFIFECVRAKTLPQVQTDKPIDLTYITPILEILDLSLAPQAKIKIRELSTLYSLTEIYDIPYFINMIDSSISELTNTIILPENLEQITFTYDNDIVYSQSDYIYNIDVSDTSMDGDGVERMLNSLPELEPVDGVNDRVITVNKQQKDALDDYSRKGWSIVY